MTIATVNRIEQIGVIRNLTSDFAQSLVRQFRSNGDLSPAQWGCVDKMVAEKDRPKVKLDFAAIMGLFNKAANSLKFPKIRLHVDGGEICLSRAGNRARRPGTINITNGRKYGEPDNLWYGRVELNGTFTRAYKCSDEVAAVLQSFSNDPAGVAAAYGKLTGNCCFCGRGLKDKRSTDMGYGPVCADNFGLVWGE